ncbi:hypothetical protein VDGL01_10305 [Verticillium dahliae]
MAGEARCARARTKTGLAPPTRVFDKEMIRQGNPRPSQLIGTGHPGGNSQGAGAEPRCARKGSLIGLLAPGGVLASGADQDCTFQQYLWPASPTFARVQSSPRDLDHLHLQYAAGSHRRPLPPPGPDVKRRDSHREEGHILRVSRQLNIENLSSTLDIHLFFTFFFYYPAPPFWPVKAAWPSPKPAHLLLPPPTARHAQRDITRSQQSLLLTCSPPSTLARPLAAPGT